MCMGIRCQELVAKRRIISRKKGKKRQTANEMNINKKEMNIKRNGRGSSGERFAYLGLHHVNAVEMYGIYTKPSMNKPFD